ncbi:hypothetical protein V8G54_015500 [Vigna mungo]|uniref:Uncharacterized protein n=1 Tax=Vigna mungo TaxID=3915 RepID=A0AAQ3NJJ6_VIGMU
MGQQRYWAVKNSTNVIISGGEKIDDAKMQHYRPKVFGAQDGTKNFLTQVIKFMVKHVILSFVVQLVSQSKSKPMLGDGEALSIGVVKVLLTGMVAAKVAAGEKPTDPDGGRRRSLAPMRRKPPVSALDFEIAEAGEGSADAEVAVKLPDCVGLHDNGDEGDETAEADEGSADAEVAVAIPDYVGLHDSGDEGDETAEGGEGSADAEVAVSEGAIFPALSVRKFGAFCLQGCMTAASGDAVKGFSLLRMHAGFEPVKEKVENDGSSEKSNSSSPGYVLGLGNYGSHADDEDNEIESSSVPTPAKMLLTIVNGISQLHKHSRYETNFVNAQIKTIVDMNCLERALVGKSNR